MLRRRVIRVSVCQRAQPVHNPRDSSARAGDHHDSSREVARRHRDEARAASYPTECGNPSLLSLDDLCVTINGDPDRRADTGDPPCDHVTCGHRPLTGEVAQELQRPTPRPTDTGNRVMRGEQRGELLKLTSLLDRQRDDEWPELLHDERSR